MSYKAALQANNIDLSAILTNINELPNQSAGGSSEALLQTKTIIPSESSQNISPDAGYDGFSSIMVEAIPSNYVGSSVARQGLTHVTPTEDFQTIVQARTYVTDSIIVSSIPLEYIVTTDANATESDIASGKTAYVNGVKITGTLVVQNYYVGDTQPDSSIGSENDLYFVRG